MIFGNALDLFVILRMPPTWIEFIQYNSLHHPPFFNPIDHEDSHSAPQETDTLQLVYFVNFCALCMDYGKGLGWQRDSLNKKLQA